MRTLQGTLLALGVGTLLLATGCKSLSCSNPDAYSKAQEVPRLKMPVGLDGPDTSQSLDIPALNEPEVPPDPTGACLEEPPVLKISSAPPTATGPGVPDAGSMPGADEPPQKRTRPISPPR